MYISYNWLKDYLSFDMPPEEVASALTSIGLETGSVEKIETIKGGMEGLVVGEVLTCSKHPNADHLSLTTVNIGDGIPLPLVCGAPNVAAGQKVIVAPVGTILYDGDKEIKIKKGKIRGEESHGMICAEDEIGLSDDHSGIIVLPADTPVGLPAKNYFHIANDYIFEVDITPNRIDGASHIGVARDLAAWLKQNNKPFTFQKPSVGGAGEIGDGRGEPVCSPNGDAGNDDHMFRHCELAKQSSKNDDLKCTGNNFQLSTFNFQLISVEIENPDACLRYSGVTIRNITVKESPEWLKKRLTSIGLRPINNIVDITNYVLHETGQPLHAFDATKIKGNKVIVRTLPEGTKFITLDEVERTLTNHDLMICDTEGPLAIGGVFGGLDSGVTENTTTVFLESACFNPSWVRKTARRFGLNTDASFRFERGLDPNQTIYALKRAALLMQDLAGGIISGDIQDIYPQVITPFPVYLSYKTLNALTGKAIPVETVKDILLSLEITIEAENQDGLSLRVPVYRYDVRREIDVIEEILRIYGFNNIDCNNHVNASLTYQTPTDKSYKLENIISEQLCGAGFNEIINNSLTRLAFYDGLETLPASNCVLIKNPLSADLNAMRQTLLIGGLQSIAFNIRHKHKNIRFFEFGNCYARKEAKQVENEPLSEYGEDYRLGLWLTGKRVENNWAHEDESASIYELKAHVENILQRTGLRMDKLVWSSISNDIFSTGMTIATQQGNYVGAFGIVHKNILKMMDIDSEVFFAELSWDTILKSMPKEPVAFGEISKFPEVKRDLALLADKNVTFADIRKTAIQCEQKLLKEVVLFDVYEGKNLPPDKKSYAVSFYLQDSEKTLTDTQIDAIMLKIRHKLEDRLNIQLR